MAREKDLTPTNTWDANSEYGTVCSMLDCDNEPVAAFVMCTTYSLDGKAPPCDAWAAVCERCNAEPKWATPILALPADLLVARDARLLHEGA